jgi:3',5'-cyclic AMP phosphodiesterase CpdA
VRIVALSDQHGFLPVIPPCDLVIVGGDVCPDRVGPFLAMQHPDRQKEWFDLEARPWLAGCPAKHRVLTWGNHDWCGQAYSFEADAPGRASSTGLQILVDEVTHVPDDQTARSISIWATPWSNRFMDWAFMKSPSELAQVYAAVPEGTDILVSHQPPYGCGDGYHDVTSGTIDHLGSRELLETIARVRPKLVICGHIHEARGRFEYDGVPIYNVSVVDREYRLVHEPTIIDFP